MRDSASENYADSAAFIDAVTTLPEKHIEKSIASQKHVFIPNNPYTPGDWLVPVLVFLFFATGILVRHFGSRTFTIIKEFFTGISSDPGDGNSLFTHPPGKYLTAIAASGVGLFSFLGIDYYLDPGLANFASFGLFLLLTLTAVIVAFLKLLVYEILAVLFDLKSVSGDFFNYYFGFLITAGVVLLPFSVFLAYSNLIDFEYGFIAGCVATGVLFILKLGKVFYRYTFHYRFSPGYNILYLCSLEFLPWLLAIVKVVK